MGPMWHISETANNVIASRTMTHWGPNGKRPIAIEVRWTRGSPITSYRIRTPRNADYVRYHGIREEIDSTIQDQVDQCV